MNQRIFSSTILVVIGILIGLFILTSYQFHKRVQATENYVLQNSNNISVIENFINTQILGNNQQEAEESADN